METRPKNEILQTGITAEDVLAVYDKFCAAAYHHNDAFYVANIPDHYTPSAVTFASISAPAPISPETDDIQESPYYVMSSFIIPHLLSNGIKVPAIKEPAYNATLTIEYMYDPGFIFENKYDIGISKRYFDNMASAFGHQSFKLTQEHADYAHKIHPGLYLESDINAPTYEAFTIDREAIENATEEQLWALYNMLSNVKELNFPNYNQYIKDNDIDYAKQYEEKYGDMTN